MELNNENLEDLTVFSNTDLATTGKAGLIKIVGSFVAGFLLRPLICKAGKLIMRPFRKEKDDEGVIYTVDGEQVELVKE